MRQRYHWLWAERAAQRPSAARSHKRPYTRRDALRGQPGFCAGVAAAAAASRRSMKLGRSLVWNAAKHEVVGDAEANKLLNRPYRAGHTHPAG